MVGMSLLMLGMLDVGRVINNDLVCGKGLNLHAQYARRNDVKELKLGSFPSA